MTKIFYPNKHAKHAPKKDYSDGLPPFDYMELPSRVDAILSGIKQSARECEVVYIDGEIEDEELFKIHSKEYAAFLKAICNELKEGEEYIPAMFGKALQNAPIKHQGGMFTREIGSPIVKGTYTAAKNSAQCAFEAAKHFVKHTPNLTVALCRPPGHHAGSSRYGGYSFFNNAAIAATTLLHHSYKPVILDIDYHIGDGTAELSSKHDFSYYSLHIDPWRNYPYLDKDVDFGQSARLVHLHKGTTSTEYLQKLQNTVNQIAKEQFDVLVLSLGFDILQTDWCQDGAVEVKIEDMQRIGQTLSSLKKPIIVVLEGGYDIANLQESAAKLFKGLQI